MAAVNEQPAPKRIVTKVHLELTSTRVPFQFELLHLGKVIWSGDPAGNQVTTDVSMEFPKEGIDLELKGGWKDGESVAAVQLKVTSENGESAAKSVWGKKDFDEVLTIP